MKNKAIELCDEEGNDFIVNNQRVKPYQKEALNFDADDDIALEDEGGVTMELYMKNIEHGRMILESVENGPLIWPTVEENGVTRTKKYAKLSAGKKIQADCNMKETNIILQGLPADIYSLINHHRVAKDL
uniref:Uncharacterized protein n=1 Tax=Tanacetum cinerariifolium TaxID=118510 RepID=A0A6L2NRD2_TANCI|nr:hypothetical protein [Tanacetum cinerariifolium]